MDKYKFVLAFEAIFGLLFLAGIALSKGIDGNVLLGIGTTIGVIVGFVFGRKRKA